VAGKVLVTARDRLQRVTIDKLIARENHPVRRLGGIIVLSIFREGLRVRRNMGAPKKGERGCQYDSTVHGWADVAAGRRDMGQRGVSCPDDSET
jgi:hypothetical protein